VVENPAGPDDSSGVPLPIGWHVSSDDSRWEHYWNGSAWEGKPRLRVPSTDIPVSPHRGQSRPNQSADQAPQSEAEGLGQGNQDDSNPVDGSGINGKHVGGRSGKFWAKIAVTGVLLVGGVAALIGTSASSGGGSNDRSTALEGSFEPAMVNRLSEAGASAETVEGVACSKKSGGSYSCVVHQSYMDTRFDFNWSVSLAKDGCWTATIDDYSVGGQGQASGCIDGG